MLRTLHRRCSAFTLIEMLVTISIVALLIVLLLPALASARDSAKAVACLSNTRAIAVAMQLYADDDPLNFYPTPRMPSTNTALPTWLDLTTPYIEALKVYRCPSDNSDNWDAPAMPRLTSYGINAYFTPNHQPYNGITPIDVQSPSQTIIAAELVEEIGVDHFMPMYWGTPPRVSSMMMQGNQWDAAEALPKTIAIERHKRTANYVFTDGHAATHEFDDTWSQTSGSAPGVDWYDPKH